MTSRRLNTFARCILRGARREVWLSLCLMAFCLGATGGACAAERPQFAKASQGRPNIVLIMADDK
jgi:hypothetical protein